MKKVKRTFFITESEAKELRKKFKDGYIYHQVPHFELEDGTIIYGKIGYPAGGEVWYGKAGEDSNGYEL